MKVQFSFDQMAVERRGQGPHRPGGEGASIAKMYIFALEGEIP